MPNSINVNMGAQLALQYLNATSKQLQQTQDRVNTGLKVIGPKDNAAVWAIAQNQRSEAKAFDSVKESLERGQSVVGVTQSAGESISDLLTGMKELALSASDKNLDATSRSALEADFNARARQVRDFIKNASFNGINLLDGSAAMGYSAMANTKGTSSITVGAENLTLRTSAATAGSNITGIDIGAAGVTFAAAATFTIDQDNGGATAATTVNIAAGTYTAEQMSDLINNALSGTAQKVKASVVAGSAAGTKAVQLSATTTAASDITVTAAAGVFAAGDSATNGVAASGGGGILELATNTSFTTSTNYDVILSQIDTSISNVSAALARIGASNKQMDSTVTFISKLQDTMDAMIGNMVDADLGKESAKLQSLQTKQQLGVQALSIANQSSGILLSLFRG